MEGTNRGQGSLLPESLDDFVPIDHPVRVIDAYIDTLDLIGLGFSKAQSKETGRKPYHPGDLLKLYVYGYLNKVTTSRRLESECHRNLEVLWLMKRLAPDFKTIADFRKDNGKAVRGACRSFIQFCREAKLLTGRLVAIDGSKFKAAASKDQALTRRQLKRDRARIKQQIDHYLAQLDEADREESRVGLERDRVGEALEVLKRKAHHLDEREQAMDERGINEHCATEPDARLMRSGREGMVLGYNVQTAVEARSRLIVHHAVVNEAGDSRQLKPMATQAKAALGDKELEVLADAGYANGGHLDSCERQEITATVPRRMIPSKHKDLYQKADFDYDPERNCYRCPAGEVLHYARHDERRNHYVYQRSGCEKCVLQSNCTPSKTRTITRHVYEAAYARSQARLAADPTLMHKRMAIAERPFAILKQVLSLRRFNCRGINGARSEMAIGVLSYNLLQMIQTHGVPRMLAMIG
jgi:transposase